MKVDEAQAGHRSAEELTKYFMGTLPEYLQGKVEEHVAGCERCAELARRVGGFASMWEGWSAQSHAEAYAAERRSLYSGLSAALRRVRSKVPVIQDRVDSWLARLPWRAGDLAPAHDQETSLWGFWGQHGFGRGTLAAAGTLTSGESQPSMDVVVMTPAEPYVPVTVTQAEVEVRVLDLSREEPHPLLLLTPLTGDSDPVIRMLAWTPNQHCWSVRIESIAPGEYLAALDVPELPRPPQK